MNFIFLLIGLLLVIVLFQIFRSSEILGVATKKVSKSFEDSNNRYNAILGVIFLIGLIFSIFWYAIKEYKHYNLPIASEHAPGIELIFWVTMAITMSVFIVTQIVMFYFFFQVLSYPVDVSVKSFLVTRFMVSICVSIVS